MLTSPGIGSGLDINSLVGQLVAAEGQSASFRLDRREASFTAELSALGSLKSALSTFQKAVQNLDDISDFRVRKAATSDKDVITASASDTAAPGSYDVEVMNLASAHRIRSGNFVAETTVVGEGTLTIANGTENFSLTIDSTNSTLADIRDAINNASDNTGVSAAIVNIDDGSGGTVSRLVLSSDDTGTTNALSVTTVDADGNDTDTAGLSQLVYDAGVTENMTELTAAQDALVRVFGQDVTRSSNSISDAISGVTLDLVSAAPGTVETITVTNDGSAVTGRVNEFVKAYNGLQSTMAALGNYDQTTDTAGVLIGDATLRTVASRIRSELGAGLTGTGITYRTLADIGVTTGEDGQLSFESSKLESVLKADFNAVGNLFAGSGGYAERLDAMLEPYVGTDSILDSRVTGLQSRVERIGGDRIRLEERLSALESRLQSQFFAMDQIVSRLTTTSDFLTQQLANLPSSASNRR